MVQLMRQYPSAFEYNDFLLRFLAYHSQVMCCSNRILRYHLGLSTVPGSLVCTAPLVILWDTQEYCDGDMACHCTIFFGSAR